METTTKPKHIGRNISRIRELRGMKQEALAIALGVSQQTISTIENSATVEEDRLEQIAKELGMTTEAIKNFSEENVVNFFNSFYDNSGTNSAFGNNNQNHFNFNPIDKLVEAYEENKALYRELLQSEKDKVAYLEKLLNK
ncbi:helix-turn-helix domain-containing protein [Flavobacterium sp. UBA7682]|uniref:helix-turn-helix domain-containing protein n=1 Tax=Flavobacterium sp. UBA7682 TaxID=1946560 RepID=UPI0025C1B337|nr:helix-turn-helix transcriptional regulator [Flavobacterium sp. UBA7682]